MEMQDDSIDTPDDFYCSISGMIIFDPVIVVESGHSYEREKILEWFSRHQTDPQSGKELNSKAIVDNLTLRRVILQHISKNPSLYYSGDLYLPASLKQSIIQAYASDNLPLFKECLSNHPGLLTCPLNPDGETLLTLLVQSKKLAFIEQFLLKFILNSHIDYHILLSEYKINFHTFCRAMLSSQDEAATKILSYLLQQLSVDEINACDESGFSLVHYAVMVDKVESLKLLAQYHADFKSKIREDDESEDENGLNAMMIVCALGNLNAVNYILDLPDKINLSATTMYKGSFLSRVSVLYYFANSCTAIQIAAFNGHLKVLERLLSYDNELIKQTSEDENGKLLTLLDWAVVGEQLDVVQWLLSNTKILNSPVLNKQQTILRAGQRCHVEIVKLLWEYGFRPPDVKAFFHDTMNFLTYDIDDARKNEIAHKSQHFPSLFSLLIHYGADIAAIVNGEHILHLAVRKGLDDIVQFLLRQGVQPDCENQKGRTPLMLAVIANNIPLSRILLQYPVNIHKTDCDKKSFLHHANSNDMTEILIEKGADLDLQDNKETTPLMQAVITDNIPVCRVLLQYSVNIHAIDRDKKSLLHHARSVNMIKILLENRVNIDVQDNEKNTPLICRFKHHQYDCAHYLVDQNADVSITDALSRTALFYACEKTYWVKDDTLRIECIRVILLKKPDLTVTDKNGDRVIHVGNDVSVLKPIVEHLEGIGKTALEIADYLNYQNSKGETVLIKICKLAWSDCLSASFLLNHGANPNLIDKNGKQAIHYLFEDTNKESLTHKLQFAEMLIGHGVNINAPCNEDGMQPLHIAVEKKSIISIRWLLNHGANKNAVAKRKEGRKDTVFEYAIWSKVEEIVSALLDAGVEINIANEVDGYTAIHWAAQLNLVPILRLLHSRGANLEARDNCNNGLTPLLRTVYSGNLDAFEYLVGAGAILDAKCSQGKNVFHLSAEEGHLKILNHLKSINYTGGVNAKCNGGLVPVFYAAKKKHFDVVKLLIGEFNAEICITTSSDKSIMHYSIEAGDDQICKYLFEQKPYIDFIKGEFTKLLFLAMGSKVSDSICEQLVVLGTDVNGRTEDNETVLISAAWNKRISFIRFLIDRGAVINEKNEEELYTQSLGRRRGMGRRLKGTLNATVIYELFKNLDEDISEESELYQTIKYLISHQAELFVSNNVNSACSLLTIAIEAEAFPVVKLLVDSGIDVKTVDKAWSLLQYPAVSGNIVLTQYLLEKGACIYNGSDYNPLVIASYHGQLEFIRFLFSKSSEIVEWHGYPMARSTSQYLKLENTSYLAEDKMSALHAAILENQSEVIPCLVDHGIPVDILTDNLTPLQFAIINKKNVCIEALLAYKPNLYVLKNGSETLLHLIMQTGDIKMAELFDNDTIAHWVEIADIDGDKPLHSAVSECNEVLANFLLDHLANVNAQNRGGQTPLHLAVQNNSKDIVDLLLKRGADVHAQDHLGKCPLHYVKSSEIVELLVTAGDQNHCINLKDKQGCTPLHLTNSLSVASELIQRGADPTIVNDEGHNALFKRLMDRTSSMSYQPKHDDDVESSTSPRIQIATLIKQNTFANLIDQYDLTGKTLLHVLCEQNDLEGIQWLCAQGVDANAPTKDKEANTPLTLSIEKRHCGLIEVLVNHGADVDRPKNGVDTPLICATKSGYIDAVRILLRLNADINKCDNVLNRSALVNAAFFNTPEIFKVLVGFGADLQIKGYLGKNVLHFIAAAGNEQIYFLLSVDNIRELYQADSEGNTPLHLSLFNAKDKMSEMLINLNFDLNVLNKKGESLLHAAVIGKVGKAILTTILSSGVDMNAQDQ